MTLGFRWYGPDDAVSLGHIAQIPGLSDIVTALHEVPTGVAWGVSQIRARQETVDRAGLTWTVVESIPVPETVKLGGAGRERGTEAWCRSLEALASCGIETVCYNFMPVFDWLRTDLALRLKDGSTTLAFTQEDLDGFDLRAGFKALPAWAEAYSPAELRQVLAAYAHVDEERLWDHLAWFLEQVVPVASGLGVKLAIHPDDPPWSVFGLPRIITTQEALARLLQLQDSPANGITFCTGSLGSRPDNDLPGMAARFAARIHFAHARSVRVTGPKAFIETAHPDGDTDLPMVLAALARGGFSGTVRPDHGRMIWGESGRVGYGLYDRALGAAYLKGILDAQARGSASVGV